MWERTGVTNDELETGWREDDGTGGKEAIKWKQGCWWRGPRRWGAGGGEAPGDWNGH